MESSRYRASLEQERLTYQTCLNVHDLPEIFHYWSNRHIQPKLLPFGFSSPNHMFRRYLEEQLDDGTNSHKRFVSLGAGNCDVEVEIALYLRDRGRTNFQIDCLDVNAAMLERGRILAGNSGVADQLTFVQADVNAWEPPTEYDAAIANQSLHHVVNLEHLFAQVTKSLRPGGVFVISDIIGRNGHRRWPEALGHVDRFWRLLPPSYRFNRQLACYEELYVDRDCSTSGFEGVRSQDILPLLLDQFQFRLFIPFGNVIDPFVDRSFGPNFDAGGAWDQDFIDRIHRLDDEEIAAGRIHPTHMLAVVQTNGTERCGEPAFPQHLSPRFCVRKTAVLGHPPPAQTDGCYQWDTWPHTPERELQIACERLTDATRQAEKETERASQLDKELDKELDERTEWAMRLDAQLRDRTEWALRLERELETELGERTAWALRLQRELEQQARRADGLDRELHSYLHNPFRFLIRLATGVRNRLRRLAGNRARL